MEAFGCYVHVPFCAARCDYCAFATWTDRPDLIERYLAACRRQVEREVAAGLPTVTSVFVGGGTPSLVPPDQLLDVLAPLRLAPGAEVTVECNPDTVTAALLRSYVDGGVNRISLGVQSMVPSVLGVLGRTHDPANVARSVELLRGAGIENWNVDLIYGAAGESVDDWRLTVEAALALEPTHISAYGLTVEPGTALFDDPVRHPDDDDQADKYLLATEAFAAAGFEWYEISNWARPGRACRHNLLYWSLGEYAAIGCAAHGHRDGRRFWNLRTPERYLEAIEQGRSPVAADERLSAAERRIEGLQLALRTDAGVPVAALPLADDPSLDGLVEVADARARLTVVGRLLANEVAVRLH